ncbi:MAG: class IV adenylate cyclase [Ardenticatenaceae bacterium]|nr:class IV adenylate cyclase [Ardenticatenaceae bacterium]
MQQNLEVEVKFLAADLEQVRAKLAEVGAVLTKARVYERNVRFDTADEALRQRDELLRLRQDTAVTLTFKGRSLEAEQQSEAKVREELEVQVSDYETAVAIIQRLGFTPQQVYEKYRETWRLHDVEIVLDELPFGQFIELEGTEAAIKETAVQLNLPWENRIVSNYLALMAAIKQRHNLPFDDLTFANFAGLPISVADVL